MIVVAYHTDNGSYEKEAALFRSSLDRAGMNYHIERFEDQGGWYANTRMKSRFIQDMRKKFSGSLLYIDVDAFVHEDCTAAFERLEREEFDFGAHWFQGPAKGYDRTKVRDEGWWMLSGTMFFGDTAGARRLIDTWCMMNLILFQQGVAEGGGQKNLWFLTTCMEDLRIARLSGRYCYVFDKAWAYLETEPCIIEHTIASRDHRDKIYQKTVGRDRRIEQLQRSLETGDPPPSPQGTIKDQALLQNLEKAERDRKAAGRSLVDAKRYHKTTVDAVKVAREALDGAVEG